jgi:hypothetical protein
MKKRTVFWLLIGIVMMTAGCNSNTYSRLRDKEDKLIKNYLSRNNINVFTDTPDDNRVWGEKDYYKVAGYDDLYFHLRKKGDTAITVHVNDVVVTRYKKFELTENADTLSYWTTLDQAHPYEFYYGITSGTSNGLTAICESVGWHEAVRLMKHPRAECEVIIPSKQGFSADETSVTPYVYIIKMVQIKQ